MELIQIIILAIVQGVTEFLPVSSSAHLILVPIVTGWQDQGLAIDVAAHLGSLFAVVFYFRRDVWQLALAGLHSCKMRTINTSEEKLFWLLAVATLPVLIMGYLARDIISDHLRHPLVIAIASIVFGLLLLYADRAARHSVPISSISLKNAIVLGLAQVLALIPGTSRSGVTMTAGLMLGLDRQAAARVSFLMAIPVIFSAAAYESSQLVTLEMELDANSFLLTAGLSAMSAFLAIHCFLRFLDRVGMLPFVIYRVVLSVVLIALYV